MDIIRTKNGSALTLALAGRLETTTAPALDQAIKEELNGVTELTFDFAGLEYISSAGLRVLLNAQKTMNQQGAMKIVNANEIVKEIFDITGFTDILTVV